MTHTPPTTIVAGHAPRAPRRQPPGHDYVRGGVRFAAELVAWIATPWALWQHSIPLAIVSVVVLIALPAVFSTPGDRPGGDAPVSVPGGVTILIVLIYLGAATTAAWVVWPFWVAVGVTALCITAVFTEQTRWKALTRRLP
ncbi:hypothetical protein [Actinotalea sp. C106]|uniref:hypothetical protein n=1 Tax=Actinotalea sp. C106 TaxID=2908644 RepID=UPI002028FC93|nr:hypothetical protein [Actinotalea sp. C106]